MPQKGARNSGVFEESRERFEKAVKGLEKDWKQFRTQIEKRRRAFEKRAEVEVRKFRKELRTSPWAKQAEKLQTELRETPLVRRVAGLRREAEKVFEDQVDLLFQNLHIASANDIGKLERKVNTLVRKVRALEKEKAEAEKAAA